MNGQVDHHTVCETELDIMTAPWNGALCWTETFSSLAVWSAERGEVVNACRRGLDVQLDAPTATEALLKACHFRASKRGIDRL